MKALEWRKLGRPSAWAYGGLAIVGGVLVTVVSIGIPPTEPDLAKHYSYVREIWPGLYISFLLFIAAFLSLIPLGLALREFFGRSPRIELLYASFLAAAILGVIWMLVQAGSAQTLARDSAVLWQHELQVLRASSTCWSCVLDLL